jgi:hypothetical protein
MSQAAGRYLRAGGYQGAFPETLGFLAAHGKYPSAMVAAFRFCDEPEPGVIRPPATVRAVHVTSLSDGSKATEGTMSGLPIVLAPVNDGLGLTLVEEIEDGLCIFDETGLGVWAAGSADNMPKIAAALPAYVESVALFARDGAGLRFAKEAARLLRAMGIEVHLKGLG